jgi:adenylyltransferase/sulfurtransferase
MGEIDVHALKQMLDHGEVIYLVDVREPWEHGIAALPGSVLLPLAQLADRAAEVKPPEGALVVAYCHHGIRSRHAAALLERIGHRAVSLKGGIDHWSLAIDRALPRY